MMQTPLVVYVDLMDEIEVYSKKLILFFSVNSVCSVANCIYAF